jgi:hypothetical protein
VFEGAETWSRSAWLTVPAVSTFIDHVDTNVKSRRAGHLCPISLAIQRAENPQGKCEIYHYNSDGTLDWGYFQINTVHLKRPGLNLRDLLDCKANIDFAYQLYEEKHGFTPWSTYNSGRYRQFLASQ